MQKERYDVTEVKELAEAIIMECNKWIDSEPKAVFRHGYAREKLNRMIHIFVDNEKGDSDGQD